MAICEKLIYVCCDYCICAEALRKSKGESCDPVEAALWISDNLIDLQEPTECESCEGRPNGSHQTNH